ncbi:hypothetical protein M0R45_001650 [Rubus argutus]|uniref:Uncharacterized protein n=1 Tax=Rubus argutus TaxID=59490 RepID=A0AAW1VGH4_RUBAR
MEPLDCSSPLAPDSPSELDILGHDGDALGVNGAEIGVLKEADKVGLRRLLQRQHGVALESQVRLEVLRNFPNQPLERQLPYQQLRALLVLADFTERHRPRPVPVRLLHSSGRRGRLPSSLRCQLLPRSLPSGRLPSSLLRTGHRIEPTFLALLLLLNP